MIERATGWLKIASGRFWGIPAAAEIWFLSVMKILDRLIASLRGCCQSLPDLRQGGDVRYTMADLSAFSLFFMQSPSFLAHQRRLEEGQGRSNCQNGLRHDSNPTKLGLMDCAGLADAYLIGMSEGPNFDAAMERRFQEYVEDLGTVVGNDARRRGLSDYMTGLLLPGERKSLEPIAERLESGNVSRRHQSIQHFVSEASWKDGPVRERVLGRVVPAMQKRGTIEHWIVDDTTLLKSGRHSVGVAIQYSGLVGTTASRWSACRWRPRPSACRSPAISTCPRTDRKRRLHAGVPPHLTFRTKIEMAIDQIRHAVAAGLPRGIVLADAAYGGARRFRDALRDLALSYALGIESNTTVVPTADPANGRTRSVKVQAGAVRVDVLASAWEPHHWRPVSWREGSAGQLSGRFAARRVQVAPTQRRDHLDPEEWLIVQDAEAAKASG